MKTSNEFQNDLQDATAQLTQTEERLAQLKSAIGAKIRVEVLEDKAYTASARSKDSEDVRALESNRDELRARIGAIHEAIEKATTCEAKNRIDALLVRLAEISEAATEEYSCFETAQEAMIEADQNLLAMFRDHEEVSRQIKILRRDLKISRPSDRAGEMFPLIESPLSGLADGRRIFGGAADRRYAHRVPGWMSREQARKRELKMKSRAA